MISLVKRLWALLINESWWKRMKLKQMVIGQWSAWIFLVQVSSGQPHKALAAVAYKCRRKLFRLFGQNIEAHQLMSRGFGRVLGFDVQLKRWSGVNNDQRMLMNANEVMMMDHSLGSFFNDDWLAPPSLRCTCQWVWNWQKRWWADHPWSSGWQCPLDGTLDGHVKMEMKWR